MDKNNRPHSRRKTTESGSVGVGKGDKINTGSRPVGGGVRPGSSGDDKQYARPQGQQPASGQQYHGQTQQGQRASQPLNLKKLLIIALIVIAVMYFMKSCKGGGIFGSDSPSGSGESYSQSGQSGTHQGSLLSGQPTANDTNVDLTVSPLAREKRVKPLGGGRDTVTVMVYMCGTDLESRYGMGTNDLQEMLSATISDKVNVIVETGGCKQWKNNVVSSDRNQIYKVENDGLRLLEDNAGRASMTDPTNLTEFIKYCKKNYPADRNVLIFWDHGGGSLSGYGYDEKNPGSSTMTLSKIDSALKSADCTFDWIGFDACLMATLETALVCNNYADYLIASEELEPGTGWDYTSWLTKLSENTSISTVELAQNIIDNFVYASTSASPSAQVTLSVIDLAELQGALPTVFRDFASSTNELLQSDNYEQVSNARAGVRQFAQSNRINQVDLVDLALRIGTDESKKLADALQGCVKYNKSTISRCYGVSIYFPYETTSSVNSAVASYNDLGIDSEYTKCIQSFASLEYGGQIAASASQNPYSLGGGDLLGTLLNAYSSSGSSTSPLGSLLGGFTGSGGAAQSSPSAGFSLDPSTVLGLLQGFSGRSMPEGFEWVDTQLIADHAQSIADNYINPARITASDKNGKSVLRLTEEEWALIQTVELNVFVEDGGGYIDLGLDNTFEWDGDDLLLDYDGTWLTLNGSACAYYLVSNTENDDGSWTTVGRIPALLNGEPVNLRVVFDDEYRDGVVTGAYPMYEDVDVQAKGDIEIVEGDSIVLLCDYYDLDGSYSASYELGMSFAVPQGGLTLRNRKLDVDGVSVTYRLTDIYGNRYWLPVNG
ncbi:MAG: peptidase C11 [Oscillospiraceae bacterium]|nr:peptidase C11 [Oscillospiraceae bacterium]